MGGESGADLVGGNLHRAQGLVDGQCYGYITFLACKFNEVQKYITEVHYTYQLQPMILSQRAFRKMSPEMQTLITDAGRDAFAEYVEALQSYIKR